MLIKNNFREKWKGKVPPYRPVFMDGWSPDYPVTDEIDDRRELVPLSNSIAPVGKSMRIEETSVQHEVLFSIVFLIVNYLIMCPNNLPTIC